MAKECIVAENKKKCSCPDKSCERHGLCCKCVAYHRGCGDLPMCLRGRR